MVILDALVNSNSRIETVTFAEDVSYDWLQLVARAVPQTVGVTLSGGAGAGNVLAGNDGDDIVTGLAGAGELLGNGGNDQLFGQDAADILDGGTGNDVLQGGLGDDTYRFAEGFGQDVLTDDAGMDTVAFAPGIAEGDLVVELNGNDLILSLTGRDDRLTITGGALAGAELGIAQVTFDGGSTLTKAELIAAAVPFNADGLVITAPLEVDDVLVGTPGPDSIYADEGNDQISGSFGADYLAGGDGDDVLEGGPDADFLDGGRAGEYTRLRARLRGRFLSGCVRLRRRRCGRQYPPFRRWNWPGRSDLHLGAERHLL